MSASLKLQYTAFAVFGSFISLNFGVVVLKNEARILLELELQLSSPSTPNISKVA